MTDDLKALMHEALAAYTASGVHGAEGARAMKEGLARIEYLEARAEKAEAERAALGRKLNTALYGEPHFGVQALEARIEALETEVLRLREALAKADELAGAIENDVRQSKQTRSALTAYREARDALNREPHP